MGTLHHSAGPLPYDVSLPDAGLGWERVGPLFERYSVSLAGRIDRHWAETYQRVALSKPVLGRFRLDADAGTVSFTCRSTDGPVEVMAVLRILAGFLESVNREASFTAAKMEIRVDAPAPLPGSARALSSPEVRPVRAASGPKS